MLLLEFSCCRHSSEQSNGLTKDTFLVGVLLKEEVECVAFELAARELLFRGFVVLKVRRVSRCRQRDCSGSDMLGELWDQAERKGITVFATESSVRHSGGEIRDIADKDVKAWKDQISVTSRQSTGGS